MRWGDFLDHTCMWSRLAGSSPDMNNNKAMPYNPFKSSKWFLEKTGHQGESHFPKLVESLTSYSGCGFTCTLVSFRNAVRPLLAGLNNLLAAYEDKSAYAQCTFAYAAGPDDEPQLFVGRTNVSCGVPFVCHDRVSTLPHVGYDCAAAWAGRLWMGSGFPARWVRPDVCIEMHLPFCMG